MDGSSRQVVVDTRISWPNGITLDLPNRYVLCFVFVFIYLCYRLPTAGKNMNGHMFPCKHTPL